MNRSRKSVCKSKPPVVLPPMHGHKKSRPSFNNTTGTADMILEYDDDTPTSEEAPDLYGDLRFAETACILRDTSKLSVKFCPTRSVLVKRPRRDTQMRPDPGPKFQGRMLPSGTKEELQMYNVGSSALLKTAEANQTEPERHGLVHRMRMRSLQSQSAALHSWSAARDQWNSLATKLSRRLDRPPETLLLSRSLCLPSLQNHRARSLGPTSDFPPVPQWKQLQRFYNRDAFFLLPDHMGPEDDSLFCSLSWSQRQQYKPPLSIVRPDLSQKSQSPVSCAQQNARTHQQSSVIQSSTERVQCTGHSAELSKTAQDLKLLYLQGESLDKERTSDPTESRLPLCGGDMQTWKEEIPQHAGKVQSCERKGLQLPEELSPWPQQASSETEETHRENCTELSQRSLDSSKPRVATLPAFKLHTFTFTWGQPCTQDIVEIGVVCNAGEKGLTLIHLANVGCCAMRYWWRRVPHKDPFNTGRYRPSPFVFDCSEGSLLPDDQTGEIAVSLWGQALEVDIHRTDRERLDQMLRKSALQRASDRQVWDLVKFLPIRSPRTVGGNELSWMPVKVVPDDVAMFQQQNQGMQYHSTAMLLLLTAQRELQMAINTDFQDLLADQPRNDRVGRGKRGSQTANLENNTRRIPTMSGGRQGFHKDHRPSIMDVGVPYATVDRFQRPRSSIVVSELHRQTHSVEDDWRKKEEILSGINQAVMMMSLQALSPNQDHLKHIIMRQALVHTCDDIDRAEWRLRSDLGHLNVTHFERLASFPQEDRLLNGKKRSLTKERRKRKTTAKGRRKDSTPEETPFNWAEPRCFQYRQKLAAIVCARLSAVLEAMLPIMTMDSPPLKP